MWEHSYVECLPNTFSGKARFDMDSSHDFPDSVVMVISLVDIWLMMEKLEPVQGVWQNFLSA